MTAKDLMGLGVIDEVVAEPMGGAHRDPQAMLTRMAKSLSTQLSQLEELSPSDLLVRREQKFRKMSVVAECPPLAS